LSIFLTFFLHLLSGPDKQEHEIYTFIRSYKKVNEPMREKIMRSKDFHNVRKEIRINKNNDWAEWPDLVCEAMIQKGLDYGWLVKTDPINYACKAGSYEEISDFAACCASDSS